MNARQVGLIKDLTNLLLPGQQNPIPYLTRLSGEFEGETVDPAAVAGAEAALLTYGRSIAATVQGEESRRAAASGTAPYQFAGFTWTPSNGSLTERVTALAAGLQQLYDSTIRQDEPAPPSS